MAIRTSGVFYALSGVLFFVCVFSLSCGTSELPITKLKETYGRAKSEQKTIVEPPPHPAPSDTFMYPSYHPCAFTNFEIESTACPGYVVIHYKVDRKSEVHSSTIPAKFGDSFRAKNSHELVNKYPNLL